MGNLSHTVGGTDNLVSFKSAARMPIDSLKVHFSPIQEGEGDPSPDNIRLIKGWNEVEAYNSGKNVAQVVGYNAVNTENADAHNRLSNNCGTTINTNNYNLPDSSVIITQTQAPNEASPQSYNNGYFVVMVKNLIYGCHYDVSFKITNITNNILNTTLDNIRLLNSAGSYGIRPTIINDNILVFKNIKWERYSEDPTNFSYNCSNFEIRNSGMSFTLSEFMVTPVGMNDGVFEPYCGEVIPVTFPVTGKNKFNGELLNINITSEGKILDSFLYNRISTSSIPVINGQYTLSCSENYPVAIYAYDDNGFIANESLVTWQESPTTFMIENAKYVRFKWKKSDDSAFSPSDITNIQLELGSEATAYEPYNPDNTIYGGYVDLAKGEVVQEYDIYTFTGDEKDGFTYIDTKSLSYDEVSERHRFNTTILDNIANVNSTLDAYCNIGAPNLYSLGRKGNIIYYIGTPSKQVSLSIDSSLCEPTIESFNQWLSEHPLQLVYKLATPIHYPLTPTQLKTFLNNNAFWSNTNDVTEVFYAVHDTAPIRAAKKRIMAASPHLETASGGLVNFNTDFVAPLKECKIEFKPKQDLHGYDRPWVGGAGKNLFAVKDAIGVQSDAAYGLTVMINSDESITISGIPTWTNTNVSKSFRVLSIESGIYYGDAPVSHDYTGLGLKWFVVSKSNNISSVNTAGGISSDGTLTVSMTNTDLNEINVVLRGLICENASNETEWSPYENICPIEGWNSFETYKTSKSIIPFLANPFSFSYQDYYNGSSGWSNVINSGELPTGAQLTYSAYLNCTNAVVNGENCVKIWIMQSNGKYRYAEGNIIQTGNSGMSYISTNVRDTDVSFEFGLGIRKGTIASDPMVEINNAPSNFEPYNGTTIPITFPSEAGTIYGGYIDLVNGEIVQEWEIATARWGDIKESDADSTTGYYHGRMIFNNKIVVSHSETDYGINTISNVFSKVLWNTGEKKPDHYYCGNNNNNKSVAYLFADYPDDTVIQIAARLAEPIRYVINPQILKTLRGTNNIWSTSNGPISIKYWKH